ncbi:MAG: hypothetical protein Ct9H300mP28_24340 [Pseudomonadota bacterium]|nr:MAG: hypothetical protein Ct9H300mP28_24340 [Pseudomonadota bacterium]
MGKQAAEQLHRMNLKKSNLRYPGCGFMWRNVHSKSMASAIEALGMSLPNSSAQEAVSEDKCVTAFKQVKRLTFDRKKYLPTRHSSQRGI